VPYVHDGILVTLEDVVDHYDRRGNLNPPLGPEIRSLHLSPTEKQQLTAFLLCLSGLGVGQ